MKIKELKRGFTLVELMVAILIFALGIVGAVRLQMAAVINNSASLQLSEAVSFTVDTIERLKNLGLTSTSFGLGNHTGAAVTSAQGRVFTPAWNVSAIGATKARNVTVTVTWEEKGMSHSTALSFVKGPNQP